jgi:hypothetical protein
MYVCVCMDRKQVASSNGRFPLDPPLRAKRAGERKYQKTKNKNRKKNTPSRLQCPMMWFEIQALFTVKFSYYYRPETLAGYNKKKKKIERKGVCV